MNASSLEAARKALPVTAQLLREARSRSRRNVSVLVVQHLMSDTANFIRLLADSDYDVFRVIGIEYSSVPEVVRQLSANGFSALVPTLSKIEAAVHQALREAPGNYIV